jgi:hypothetical protein
VVCTGTATIIDAATGVNSFQLVVNREGKRVEMFHTDFGLTLGVTDCHVSRQMQQSDFAFYVLVLRQRLDPASATLPTANGGSVVQWLHALCV